MLSAKSGHKVTPFLAQQQIKADKMNNYAHKKTEIPSVDNNLFFFFPYLCTRNSAYRLSFV